MKNRRINTGIIQTALTLAALTMMSGCTPQAMQAIEVMQGMATARSGNGTVANALAQRAVQTAGAHPQTGSILKSAASQKGYVQSRVVGARMMANPVLMGVEAVSMAVSKHNEAKNRAAFGEMVELSANADGVSAGIERMMVKTYNQKHGTRYATMSEIRQAVQIEGYNKKYGTHCKTWTDLRNDYNRRNGTNYQSDEALKAALRR
jgi:hypothetical protein